MVPELLPEPVDPVLPPPLVVPLLLSVPELPWVPLLLEPLLLDPPVVSMLEPVPLCLRVLDLLR